MAISKMLFYKSILLGLAYFAIGLCVSIIGPTLPDIMSQTNSTTLTRTATVITSNSCGIIIGIILASLCVMLANSFCALALSLFLCFLTTIVIPFCTTLLIAGLAFFLQGVSLGLIYKGVINQLYLNWKHRYQIVIIFSIVLAFGAALSPMITSKVVFDQMSPLSDVNNNISLSKTQQKRAADDDIINGAISNFSTEANWTTTDFESLNETSSTSTTSKVVTLLNSLSPPSSSPSSPLSTSSTSSTSSSTTSSVVTIYSAPSTTTPLSMQQYWNRIKNMVKQLNNAKVAYLLIATFCLLSTFIYLVTCCCLSRKLATGQQQPQNDGMFALKSVTTSRDNAYMFAASLILAYLFGSIESVMSNLITVYFMQAFILSDQSRGALLTGVFWTAVAVSRLAAALFRKKLDHFIVSVTVNVLIIVALSAMAVFSRSVNVLWLSVAVFGSTFGHLEPWSISYIDQRLNIGSWFCTAWLISGQCGRASAPLLTVWLMENTKSNALCISALCFALLLVAATVFFSKRVATVDHNKVVDRFDEIFAYRRHVNEDETATELDEYTYFHKNQAVSYYVNKSNPLATILK